MRILALTVACFVFAPLVPAESPAPMVQVTGTVTRVMDGDTAKVREANGAETTIRLEGIDALESVQPF